MLARSNAPTLPFLATCTFALLAASACDISISDDGDDDAIAATDDGGEDAADGDDAPCDSEGGHVDDGSGDGSGDDDATSDGSGSDAAEGSTDASADTPPEITIVTPETDLVGDAGFEYDGYDKALELWYVDVDLTAEATDAEDGDLSAAVEWSTDQGAIQDAALGSGATINVRLYSDDCFGTLHTLTATVTDSDGNTVTSMPRQLNLWTLC